MRHSRVLVPLVLTLPLALASCSGDDPTPSAASASRPSPTPRASASTPIASATATATPTASASASASSATETVSGKEPSATSSASAVPTAPTAPTAPSTGSGTSTSGVDRYARLLTAGELPGLDDGYTWSEVGSVPEEGEPFTECQRFLMADIGAANVVVRRFDPTGAAAASGDEGGELVAGFGDARTAERATATLRSWQDSCAASSATADVTVSGWNTVSVPRGDAAWYTVDVVPAGNPADRRSERVTVVRRGARVAVVRTLLMGDMRAFEPGQDPAALSARPAWDRLG